MDSKLGSKSEKYSLDKECEEHKELSKTSKSRSVIAAAVLTAFHFAQKTEPPIRFTVQTTKNGKKIKRKI